MSFEGRINRTIEGGTLLSDAQQANDRVRPDDIDTSNHFLIKKGKLVAIKSKAQYGGDETQLILANGDIEIISNNAMVDVYNMREAVTDTTSGSDTRP